MAKRWHFDKSLALREKKLKKYLVAIFNLLCLFRHKLHTSSIREREREREMEVLFRSKLFGVQFKAIQKVLGSKSLPGNEFFKPPKNFNLKVSG